MLATRMRMAAAGVSTGFTDPGDLDSIAVWLDADSISQSDNTDVTTWSDLSGNGFDAVAQDIPLKYRTNQVNGLPAMQFGSNMYCTIDDWSSVMTSAAHGFAVVYLATEAIGNNGGLWQFGQNTESTHYPFSDGNIYDGFFSSARKSTGNPTPSLAAWRLYEVVSVSGEWTSWIDGTQHYTTSTNTFSQTQRWLGRSTAYAFDAGARVAEVIICNEKLSSGDRSNVHGYIEDKYALTIA